MILIKISACYNVKWYVVGPVDIRFLIGVFSLSSISFSHSLEHISASSPTLWWVPSGMPSFPQR